ncbi:MAG: hypothetical protein COV52_01785 [Gammaproteobacteria bacterium CG11_big_fil_rev_8_21_14_0_20_46_22]|nr:MAG: hypothetical protein COW05_05680 [Gammaproteobacteria bacterium CG12_big_fil_rev_8_21_14_0_65_46_12]PIR11845.1 MAG: hypothetical protein COV52_01785 [Gammaproteobacteria bacterium CG11_big_fil_rev_8_21_14_0_20_46_22]
MKIDFPNEALKQISEKLEKRRNMKNLNPGYFESGLPLREEIDDFEEVERCIFRDREKFKIIIEQLLNSLSNELKTKGFKA